MSSFSFPSLNLQDDFTTSAISQGIFCTNKLGGGHFSTSARGCPIGYTPRTQYCFGSGAAILKVSGANICLAPRDSSSENNNVQQEVHAVDNIGSTVKQRSKYSAASGTPAVIAFGPCTVAKNCVRLVATDLVPLMMRIHLLKIKI